MKDVCTTEDLERRINKLEIESGVFDTSLKKDITALEKQINLQFGSSKIAVDAALAAQKELVATSFAASEKAIIKAESAQIQYNERSNEFRAALDDSNKLNMQRVEVMSLFKSFEEKLSVMIVATEKTTDAIKEDIKSLRESRSEGSGKGAGVQAGWGWAVGAIGFALASYSVVSGLK